MQCHVVIELAKYHSERSYKHIKEPGIFRIAHTGCSRHLTGRKEYTEYLSYSGISMLKTIQLPSSDLLETSPREKLTVYPLSKRG